MYEGWRIFTLSKTTDRSRTIDELRTRFNNGDWHFYENTHRLVISYGSQEFNVSFKEVKYSLGKSKNVETYHVVFDAPFLGFRTSEERVHQDFFLKTLEKIPWKKRGFWHEDNAWVLIPKKRMLQMIY